MAMNTPVRRSTLCPGCGVIVPASELRAGHSETGQCPECGLGFSRQCLGPNDAIASEPGPSYAAILHEARRRALADRPFPIYGLDESWTGSRWLGGWGGSAEGINQITFSHGGPEQRKGPMVNVETFSPTDEGEKTVGIYLRARGLAGRLWSHGAKHEVVRPTFNREDPTGTWEEAEIEVDGESVPFRMLAAGAWWVALGEVGSVVVSLRVRGVPGESVRLVPVGDVEPYLTKRLS